LSYKRFRVPAIHPIYSDPILLKPLIKGSSFPDWIEHITHKFPYGADYIITLN